MSEPIPDVPDVVATRALAALVELLHTDPLARSLVVESGAGRRPFFSVADGTIGFHAPRIDASGDQLGAAKALFGGEFTVMESYSPKYQTYSMVTTWQGVELDVQVDVQREDEVAELRKQVAELKAAQAAAGLVVAE